MREDARTRQLREASNPLFSDRKLRLGTFSSNLSGGCAISSIDGVLEADWTSTLTLAQLADEMQFEALVPVVEAVANRLRADETSEDCRE